jgi:hypothetical protein
MLFLAGIGDRLLHLLRVCGEEEYAILRPRLVGQPPEALLDLLGGGEADCLVLVVEVNVEPCASVVVRCRSAASRYSNSLS